MNDCNGNAVLDLLDILNGSSSDSDRNGVPDECDCNQDVDGDGIVGINDLLDLLAAWGPCVNCPEDIDGDGIVGITDLLDLLSAWGPCL